MSEDLKSKIKTGLISSNSNDNVRVTNIRDILPPLSIIERFPANQDVCDLVTQTRERISKILKGEDNRLLVVIGPCSIHDTKAAYEYAQRIKPLVYKYRDTLEIVMRVYFEKPRTTIGWKGLINDPYFDESYKINDGITMAREILLKINELGVPTAGEFLDTMTPQYIADLMSWGAIGARTTESQLHRELASGLSCPIGFKNATNGSMQVAIDAMLSASNPHSFIGVTKFGQIAIIETTGNDDVHVILRGGSDGPNYYEEHVQKAVKAIEKTKFYPSVMVDCSHANSNKDYRRQTLVCQNICLQLKNGSFNINGVMVESHLVEGNQKLSSTNLDDLTYGQSITDGCIGWEDTEKVLAMLDQSVAYRNANYLKDKNAK